MAYEVVKTVKGRRYRYRVESYRDETTGKPRGKWTYLGPADPPGDEGDGTTQKRGLQTKRRLLDALEALLEREEYAHLTAAAVAKEAGLGHGTFYLHFRDVREALRAAMQSVRDGISTMLDTTAPLESREAERERVAAWLTALLGTSVAKPGLLRAFAALSSQDAEIAAERRRRSRDWLDRFGRYFRALDAAGFSRVEDPDALAQLILGMIEGVFRHAVLERTAIGEPLRAYVLRAVDRAIFDP